MDVDSGPPGDIDSGPPGDVDSGPPGDTDAGPGDVDSGPSDVDAGACMPRAADNPLRGTKCAPLGGGTMCPTGYICEEEHGIRLSGSCQIPCTPGRDCECPSGLTCQGFTDKAGTDYHCSE